MNVVADPAVAEVKALPAVGQEVLVPRTQATPRVVPTLGGAGGRRRYVNLAGARARDGRRHRRGVQRGSRGWHSRRARYHGVVRGEILCRVAFVGRTVSQSGDRGCNSVAGRGEGAPRRRAGGASSQDAGNAEGRSDVGGARGRLGVTSISPAFAPGTADVTVGGFSGAAVAGTAAEHATTESSAVRYSAA